MDSFEVCYLFGDMLLSDNKKQCIDNIPEQKAGYSQAHIRIDRQSIILVLYDYFSWDLLSL